MKRFGAAQQPFELQDGIVAFCLYLAGVPFLTTRNLYKKENFIAHGFKGEVDLCEAALECVERNLKGKLEYLFAQSPELKGLLKVFSEQAAEIQTEKKDKQARDVIRDLMESFSREEISLEETVMRLACIILKLRSPFLNKWKERSPLVVIPHPGKERRFKTSAVVRGRNGAIKTVPADGVEYPGFDIISANASDKTKKHMGLA